MSNLLSPLKTIAAFAALAFVLSGCVVHNHGRNHYRSSYSYEHNNYHPRQQYWQGHDYYHNHNYQRR